MEVLHHLHVQKHLSYYLTGFNLQCSRLPWSLFSVTFFACNYNGIIILFNLGLPFFYNLFPYASIVIVRICMHVLISLLNQVKVWVYVLVMSRTHFRVNTHSIFAWMSRNPLLETGAVSRLFRARSSLTSRQI